MAVNSVSSSNVQAPPRPAPKAVPKPEPAQRREAPPPEPKRDAPVESNERQGSRVNVRA